LTHLNSINYLKINSNVAADLLIIFNSPIKVDNIKNNTERKKKKRYNGNRTYGKILFVTSGKTAQNSISSSSKSNKRSKVMKRE